jgi:sigma-B regulation protein RsbU (phosphoserine phosphatase)
VAQYAPADGETIVLYSDGITEAENAAGEDYQEDRLAHLLRERFEHDASAMADSVFHDLNQFRGSHPAADDATLLVVRRRRNP